MAIEIRLFTYAWCRSATHAECQLSEQYNHNAEIKHDFCPVWSPVSSRWQPNDAGLSHVNAVKTATKCIRRSILKNKAKQLECKEPSYSYLMTLQILDDLVLFFLEFNPYIQKEDDLSKERS